MHLCILRMQFCRLSSDEQELRQCKDARWCIRCSSTWYIRASIVQYVRQVFSLSVVAMVACAMKPKLKPWFYSIPGRRSKHTKIRQSAHSMQVCGWTHKLVILDTYKNTGSEHENAPDDALTLGVSASDMRSNMKSWNSMVRFMHSAYKHTCTHT